MQPARPGRRRRAADSPRWCGRCSATSTSSSRAPSVGGGAGARSTTSPTTSCSPTCTMPPGTDGHRAHPTRARERDARHAVHRADRRTPPSRARSTAMREGAFDYLRKTATGDELRAAVRARARARQPGARGAAAARRGGEARGARRSVVGELARMRAAAAMVERVARVGRERPDRRRERHRQGAAGAHDPPRLEPRRDGPFVAFDCSALAPSLLESGAVRPREGRVHRRAAGAARPVPRGARAARCSSTRSATSRPRCRTSCCACCRSARSSRSAATSFVEDRRAHPRGDEQGPEGSWSATGPVPRGPRTGAWRWCRSSCRRCASASEDIPQLVAHFLARRRRGAAAAAASACRRRRWRGSPRYHWPGNIRELENVRRARRDPVRWAGDPGQRICRRSTHRPHVPEAALRRRRAAAQGARRRGGARRRASGDPGGAAGGAGLAHHARRNGWASAARRFTTSSRARHRHLAEEIDGHARGSDERPRRSRSFAADGIGPEISRRDAGDLEGARRGGSSSTSRSPAYRRRGGEGSAAAATIDSIKKHARSRSRARWRRPSGGGYRSVNVALRQQFDLYANVRPVQTIAGVPSRYTDVDLVIVRENTEDLYAGVEHYVDPRPHGGRVDRDHHAASASERIVALRVRVRARGTAARRSRSSTRRTS